MEKVVGVRIFKVCVGALMGRLSARGRGVGWLLRRRGRVSVSAWRIRRCGRKRDRTVKRGVYVGGSAKVFGVKAAAASVVRNARRVWVMGVPAGAVALSRDAHLSDD